MKMVAEGVRTTDAALALGARHGVELPIAAQMAELLAGRKDARTRSVRTDAAPAAGGGRIIDGVGFFDRLVQGLTRTKQQIVERFDEIVRTRRHEPDRSATDRRRHDRGARGAADLGRRRRRGDRADRRRRSAIGRGAARACATSSRRRFAPFSMRPATGRRRTDITPHVTLIVGVNGTGKTTTVGKLASYLKASGKQPLVCAADTFRAAAVEQLEIWAKRAGVDIVRAKEGSDPAAVVFDAIQSGKARGARSDPRRHRRPPAHARQPDERARQDPPRRRARGRRRAARSAARARRHRRAERPGAGARVHERRRRHRHRAHEARWHREGRRRRGDRARPEAADPLRRRRRRHRRPVPFSPQEYVDALFQEKW